MVVAASRVFHMSRIPNHIIARDVPWALRPVAWTYNAVSVAAARSVIVPTLSIRLSCASALDDSETRRRTNAAEDAVMSDIKVEGFKVRFAFLHMPEPGSETDAGDAPADLRTLASFIPRLRVIQ